jgi:hypothetical protein
VQQVFKVKHRSNDRGAAARLVPPSDCLITETVTFSIRISVPVSFVCCSLSCVGGFQIMTLQTCL